MRKNKKFIIGILNDNDDWVTNDSDIKKVFLNYYKSLFAPKHWLPCRSGFWGINPIHSSINYDSLTAIPTLHEIKTVTMSFSDDKCLGLDGFPASFSKSFGIS